MNKREYTDTILRLSNEIETAKADIKIQKGLVVDLIEDHPEWIELQSSREEVTRLQNALKVALNSDGEYNNAQRKLADLKDDLKDKQESLSTFIVGYHSETKEMQVETNVDGTARDLVIKGKLGKIRKYQTRLGL